MAHKCCLPSCNNRLPAFSLFHAPNKHFAKSHKVEWAENLEKIILGCRSDKFILDLYKRDLVKICSAHFEESDFIQTGRGKILRVGAIPTLNMPNKLMKKTCQDDPAEHHMKPHSTFASLANAYIPKQWLKTKQPEGVILSFQDGYDQAKFAVGITKQFSMSVSYYGWKASPSCYLLEESPKYGSLASLLSKVESAQVCPGVGDRAGVMHFKIRSAHPFNTELLPLVESIKRSRQCEIFVLNGEIPCSHCSKKIKNGKRKEYIKKAYERKHKNDTLKQIRFGKLSTLSSRVKVRMSSKDLRIKQLEEQVQKLLKNQHTRRDLSFL